MYTSDVDARCMAREDNIGLKIIKQSDGLGSLNKELCAKKIIKKKHYRVKNQALTELD